MTAEVTEVAAELPAIAKHFAKMTDSRKGTFRLGHYLWIGFLGYHWSISVNCCSVDLHFSTPCRLEFYSNFLPQVVSSIIGTQGWRRALASWSLSCFMT